MAGAGKKPAGRRLGRRPALLVALGLLTSLGVAGAFAAVAARQSTPASIRALPIRVTPATRTVSPGASVKFAVHVPRNDHRATGLSGRTRLRVRRTGLPAGSLASFSGSKVHSAGLIPRRRTTLTIKTAAGAAPGTYEVRLGARRPHRRGHATVQLVVAAPTVNPPGSPPPAPAETGVPGSTPPVLAAPDAFTIAGSLANQLTPGSGEPLDLTLTNLESTDLVISSLAVQVATVSGPRRGPAHPCEPADFSVEQFSGTSSFILPAASTADLVQLGVDRGEWPVVSMRNRPVNQDGCKGATLSLSFTGSAAEASS